MLTTIAIILVVLWAIGFIGFHTVGWFIHILLVVAIILFIIRLV
ncbi:MAG: hypothetical protein JWL92_298 [Candidatus Nomurabacteria bacterium]|nr:hypothetical protein [Candidatus Nomurabacteria bacterium]